jgi:hypothetical protein
MISSVKNDSTGISEEREIADKAIRAFSYITLLVSLSRSINVEPVVLPTPFA